MIVVRDNPPTNPPPRPLDSDPSADLSVNYIPVGGPAFIPAKFGMKPGEKQFWRVLNSSAVTILDLELQFDSVPQPLEVVALDGVALGSQDGAGRGTSRVFSHLLVPTAGRAEFIVTGPARGVAVARLVTRAVDTGPAGDPDPLRPLLVIKPPPAGDNSAVARRLPAVSGLPPAPRFAGLGAAKPAKSRNLFFSEDDTFFYITVAGQTTKPYSTDDPPAIVTTQGSTEDWKVENRTEENHEFHIHQIHFKLLARNGKTLAAEDQEILDTVDVPYWSGTGPLSECESADGFPRAGHRGFRLSLPHPRPRGRRDDGDHPGPAAACRRQEVASERDALSCLFCGKEPAITEDRGPSSLRRAASRFEVDAVADLCSNCLSARPISDAPALTLPE